MQSAGSSNWVSHRAGGPGPYLSRRSSNAFSISGQVAQRRRLLLKRRPSRQLLLSDRPCTLLSFFVHYLLDLYKSSHLWNRDWRSNPIIRRSPILRELRTRLWAIGGLTGEPTDRTR